MAAVKPNWRYIMQIWPERVQEVTNDTWDQVVTIWTNAMILASQKGDSSRYIELERFMCKASGRVGPNVQANPASSFQMMLLLTKDLYIEEIDREFPLKVLDLLSKDLGAEKLYIE